MNDEIDDRFRQLVSELAATAPAAPAWSDVLARPAAPVLEPAARRPFALVAAGALVVAGAAAVALIDDEPSTPSDPSGPSVALGEGTGASCVEEYDLAMLRGRDFAFDGTVSAIEPAPSGEEDDPYVDVTFEVDEWFTPDGPAEVVVEMFPPGVLADVGTAEYSVGSRLLVAGEPRWGGAPLDSPVAWYCGFSRTWDGPTADEWREAFDAAG